MYCIIDALSVAVDPRDERTKMLDPNSADTVMRDHLWQPNVDDFAYSRRETTSRHAFFGHDRVAHVASKPPLPPVIRSLKPRISFGICLLKRVLVVGFM